MNRIQATIDKDQPFFSIGQQENNNLGSSSNRTDGKIENDDYLENLENKELLEIVGKDESQSEYKGMSDNILTMNQLSRFMKGEEPIDQLAAYRMDYQILFEWNFGLPDPKYWQNHEGTKVVVVKDNLKDGKIMIEFRLYDYRYCEVYQTQHCQLDKQIKFSDREGDRNYSFLQFSSDEKYMVIKTLENDYLFCYFEKGFEHEIFIERKYAQDSPNKIISNIFKFDTEINEIRISSLNHLFVQCDKLLYKSKLTVKQLIDKLQDNKTSDQNLL